MTLIIFVVSRSTSETNHMLVAREGATSAGLRGKVRGTKICVPNAPILELYNPTVALAEALTSKHPVN